MGGLIAGPPLDNWMIIDGLSEGSMDNCVDLPLGCTTCIVGGFSTAVGLVNVFA
jgi:hypothetical protein